MKKIFKIVFSLLIVVFSWCYVTNYVQAYNGGDITPPRCSIVIPEKVKIGKTVQGTVGCYDINGLSDTNITPSDFNIKGGLFFRKIKVVEVSSATTADNMTYTWKVKIKGNLLGNSSITLKDFAVTDKSGNGNSPVVPKNIKTTLK